MARLAEGLSPLLFHAGLHRRSARLYRKDHVYSRNEDHPCVSLLKSHPEVERQVLIHVLSRALIVNFEFEPSVEGQVAQPAAAITISTTLPPLSCGFSLLGPFLQNPPMVCHFAYEELAQLQGDFIGQCWPV